MEIAVSPVERAQRVEAAIVRTLTSEHPTQLTAEELERLLGADFASGLDLRDGIDRLERAGVVRQHGEVVAPRYPTVYMYRLRLICA